ncbi:MAG: hypothetical protein HY724_04695 [Candidatus Rokubacteria bacterium]|nr:hypothetical protein [Candidatus Rokubacteria bacterium]
MTSFLLHIWPPAFCPYCILNYGVYYWPLGAILIGVTVATVVAHSGGLGRAFALSAVATAVAFSLGAAIGVPRPRAWGSAPLEAMRRTADQIRSLTAPADKAFMIGDHHTLILSGRAFFPPLINWYYNFRRDGPEADLRRYGLWDLKALDSWLLREATVVVLPRDGVSYLETLPEGREMLGLIARRARERFSRQAVLEDAWQVPLVVYRKVT